MPSVKPVSFSFNVVPREIIKKHGRTKVQLAAILQPLSGLNGAEIVATMQRRKKRFKYSRALKKFIHDNHFNKTFFKPLEKYLVRHIRASQHKKHLPINELRTFIAQGNMANFTVIN